MIVEEIDSAKHFAHQHHDRSYDLFGSHQTKSQSGYLSGLIVTSGFFAVSVNAQEKKKKQ